MRLWSDRGVISWATTADNGRCAQPSLDFIVGKMYPPCIALSVLQGYCNDGRVEFQLASCPSYSTTGTRQQKEIWFCPPDELPLPSQTAPNL
ncbi:hypothetical protein VTP01DRAFT_10242 [Rhizomucor pusillus]|uniref:uncharacterized protein n=1 Tax=Rhizomucor pusillus TaxID=4840 RepID=UPI0037437304